MELSQVIIGPIVTEKSERMKAADKRVVTLQVAPKATKIDVKNALRKFYDVDATDVRVMRVPRKTRRIGRNQEMEKRHHYKKVMVTLHAKSKALDLTAPQA